MVACDVPRCVGLGLVGGALSSILALFAPDEEDCCYHQYEHDDRHYDARNGSCGKAVALGGFVAVRIGRVHGGGVDDTDDGRRKDAAI